MNSKKEIPFDSVAKERPLRSGHASLALRINQRLFLKNS